MIVAGLDMATDTGVCLGAPEQTPVFWTEPLGKTLPHEQRFANALKLVHRLVSKHHVTHIGIEAPFLNPKRDQVAKLKLLMGMQACIKGWAAMRSVTTQTFAVSQIDKHFLGHRWKGSGERKRAIEGMCTTLGWSPQTQDEADAGAVWSIMCATHSRAAALNITPLFAGGRRG